MTPRCIGAGSWFSWDFENELRVCCEANLRVLAPSMPPVYATYSTHNRLISHRDGWVLR